MADTTQKSRQWIGTCNNPDPGTYEDYMRAWSKHTVYCNGQLEVAPTTGTPHMQYFLHFKEATRMSALKKICKRSCFKRISVNNGADDYCMKEETRVEGPWEFGVRPARLNVKGDKKRRNMELLQIGAEEAVREGMVDIKEYPKLKQAIDLFKNCTQKVAELERMDFHWYYGKPGIGKTKRITDAHPDFYEKSKSKYWNGYTNQDVILIDDIELDETFMLGNLKMWC